MRLLSRFQFVKTVIDLFSVTEWGLHSYTVPVCCPRAAGNWVDTRPEIFYCEEIQEVAFWT